MKKPKAFSIPEPCHENWGNMSPTERGRFCDSCAKEVKDFSSSTEAEIKDVLNNTPGQVCGRFKASQVNTPEPSLLELLSTGAKYSSKIAAASALLISGNDLIAQGEVLQYSLGKTIHVEDSTYQQTDLSVNGTVTDEDGEALAFANALVYADGKFIIGTTSDIDGRFSLQVPAEYLQAEALELEVSYVGYLPVRTTIVITSAPEISLKIKMDQAVMLMGLIIDPAWEKEREKEVKKATIQETPSEVKEPQPEIEEWLMGDVMLVEENEHRTCEPSSKLAKSDPQEPALTEEDLPGPRITLEGPKPEIKLSPNPSAYGLQVECDAELSPEYLIQDSDGRIVLQGRFSGELSAIDISPLSPGYHILMVQTVAGDLLSSPFIVQR